MPVEKPMRIAITTSDGKRRITDSSYVSVYEALRKIKDPVAEGLLSFPHDGKTVVVAIAHVVSVEEVPSV